MFPREAVQSASYAQRHTNLLFVHGYRRSETRQHLIDPELRQWRIVAFSQHQRCETILVKEMADAAIGAKVGDDQILSLLQVEKQLLALVEVVCGEKLAMR